MKKREFGDYIQDILDSIDAIEEFLMTPFVGAMS